MDAELNTNLELHVEDNIRAGMSPEEARRAALLSFGSITAAKDRYRDRKLISSLGGLLRDVRYSARSMWRSKVFSFAVVATLALCIAVNATVFTLLYDLVLKPLPFENSERIVQIFNVDSRSSDSSHSSWNQYRDFQEHADLFEGFALANFETKTSGDGPLRGMRVAADFFDLMGVRPRLGRFFAPDEVDPGPSRVAVLTRTAWEKDFAADPNVIGKQLRFVHEASYAIVGVAPRSMEVFDPNVRYFVPRRALREVELDPRNRSVTGFDLWARLKPGVSHEQAMTQLREIERRWYEQIPDLASGEGRPRVLEIGRIYRLQSRLMLLQAGALLVLLVGCFNAVNLLCARAVRKRHELSVRISFGAGGLDLARLMLSESLLLATLGALAGSALSWAGLQAINRYHAVLLPKAAPAALSGAVLVSTLAVSAGVALVMGLLPIALLWKSGRIRVVDSSARSSSTGRGARTLSSALVVSQVAITFALLVGAGLLFRSFTNVLAVDPGFDVSRVVEGGVWLPPQAYSNADLVGARQRVMESMRAIPGVANVSFSGNSHMVGENLPIESVFLRGDSSEQADEPPQALVKHVSSEFFATMGIPILEGRSFRPDEDHTVFIVDEAFVERYLNDRPALGAEMKWGSRTGPWKHVVGVAGRAHFQGLERRDGLPVLYVCSNQYQMNPFALLLRTNRPSQGLMREMRAKLQQIHPGLHLYGATSLEVPVGNLHLERRGITLLSGVFAGLALLLSAIGIYGLLSYDVQQRRREIGIRSAIGARPGQVLSLVLHQGLGKTALGLGLGLLGSLYLNRFLESRLFDVAALDPWTYAVAFCLMMLIALAASYMPARRAVRVYPVESLRLE